MSELVQETLAEESPAAESRPEVSVGLVLRQARESRQMSVADVAQLLKISYRQVDALESDNWDALPGQTFVLGFIRNYARLLHLDATPLLQQIKDAGAAGVSSNDLILIDGGANDAAALITAVL